MGIGSTFYEPNRKNFKQIKSYRVSKRGSNVFVGCSKYFYMPGNKLLKLYETYTINTIIEKKKKEKKVCDRFLKGYISLIFNNVHAKDIVLPFSGGT